ncbi:hypothetical protein JCM6882_008043, partial [Rhodosporidiobolus microsporus]
MWFIRNRTLALLLCAAFIFTCASPLPLPLSPLFPQAHIPTSSTSSPRGGAAATVWPSPSSRLLLASSSPTSSPALDALSAVHYLAKRSRSSSSSSRATRRGFGGGGGGGGGRGGGRGVRALEGMVREAQVLVEAAEGEGRGKEVEEHCSGWTATLRYCAPSPLSSSSSSSEGDDGGASDCVCSSTALERMGVCRAAMAEELQGAFA